jgi:hypothetical protein
MIRVALDGILVDIFFRITVLIFMINYVFFLFFHSQFSFSNKYIRRQITKVVLSGKSCKCKVIKTHGI